MTELESRPLTTPNPDPTIATTQQLLREIANVRELIESKSEGNLETINSRINALDAEICASKRIIETRLDGMDKLLQLKAEALATQFIDRDKRIEQNATNIKTSVDAALTAAKEAIAEQHRSFSIAAAKDEAATIKQIDSLNAALGLAARNVDDKIGDIKDRLVRIEGRHIGTAEIKVAQRDERVFEHGKTQNWIAIGALITAASALAFSFFHATSTNTPAERPATHLSAPILPQFDLKIPIER
jgi:hypothetical protein